MDNCSCKICESSQGIEWTQKLQRGEKRPMDAALHFNMTVAEVDNHILNHDMEYIALVPKKKFSEKIQDPEFMMEKVGNMVDMIEHWIEIQADNEDDLDPKSIDRLVKVVKELRDTYKLVFELQGKFNKGDTYYQQLVQIQGDYKQYTGMVLDILCPNCQKKLMEFNNKR